MKIGKRTIDVLKNFSEINSGLFVNPGSQIQTMSPSKKIVAVADVDEEFPVSFGVYELGKLLGVLSLFGDPDVDIDEKAVRVSADGKGVVLVNAAEGSVITPTAKAVPAITAALEDSMVSGVSLPGRVLAEVTKAARILGLPHFEFFGDGEKVFIRAVDVKNPSSHEFSVELGASDVKFSTVFLQETFKFIPGDYVVTINGPKKLARFQYSGEGYGLTYFLAAEVSERR